MTPGFLRGYSWCMKNMDALKRAGWTDQELFKEGIFKKPLGSWGICWLEQWENDDMIPEIGEKGEIIFRIRKHIWSDNGIGTRTVEQRAYNLKRTPTFNAERRK